MLSVAPCGTRTRDRDTGNVTVTSVLTCESRAESSLSGLIAAWYHAIRVRLGHSRRAAERPAISESSLRRRTSSNLVLKVTVRRDRRYKSCSTNPTVTQLEVGTQGLPVPR
jgi:hypothetical protein